MSFCSFVTLLPSTYTTESQNSALNFSKKKKVFATVNKL